MTIPRPRVVIYTHYGAYPNGGDVTHRLYGTEGEFLRSIEPPYSSFTFALKCRFEEINTFVAVGDWVVFYDPNGRPYTWDYVSEVEYDFDTDAAGGAVTGRCLVSATNWMSLTMRSEIYVPMGDVHPTTQRGTLLSLPRWASINVSATGNYLTGGIGEALKHFHKELSRIRLPASLGGEFLGDAIPVVYNEETSNQYTAGKIIDEVSVGGGMPNHMSYTFYSSKVYELYRRLFVPEPMLIQLYPSLEPLEAGTEPPSALAKAIGARPVLIYTLAPFRAEPLQSAAFVYEDFKGVDKDHANRAARRAFKRLLGEFVDDSESLKEDEAFARLTVAAQRNAALQAYVLSTMFTKRTWPGNPVQLSDKSWRKMRLRYSDDDRINVATIGLSVEPGSGIEASAVAGLPIANPDSVENHGVRLVKSPWHFTIPASNPSGSTSPTDDQTVFDRANAQAAAQRAASGQLINQIFVLKQFLRGSSAGGPTSTWVGYMRAIAAQVVQFHGLGHKLAKGAISTSPPDAVIAGAGYRYIPLNCGETFVTPIRDGIDRLLGYANSVSHRFQISKDTGAISVVGTINYSRGVAESDKVTQFGKVPVPAGDSQPSEPSRGSFLRGNGVTAPLAPSTCRDGVPTNFPTTMSEVRAQVDLAKIPDSLKTWAIAAGYDARDIDVSSSMSQPIEDAHRALLINAACLRVVEYYWKQEFPSASLKILSSVRGDSNHKARAAADFVVIVDGKPLPVLQTWSSLNRLSSTGAYGLPAAKRIPLGGRGMYLNMSLLGLSGTGRNQAGRSSDVVGRGPYPLGGSSGVHYDYRGKFGFKLTRASGDTWIGIDGVERGGATSTLVWIAAGRPALSRSPVNGDGRDEFQMYAPHINEVNGTPNYAGDPDGSIVKSFLQTNAPDIWAYYTSLGAGDNTMFAVGPSVPNVMQVLGQVESCFTSGDV